MSPRWLMKSDWSSGTMLAETMLKVNNRSFSTLTLLFMQVTSGTINCYAIVVCWRGFKTLLLLLYRPRTLRFWVQNSVYGKEKGLEMFLSYHPPLPLLSLGTRNKKFSLRVFSTLITKFVSLTVKQFSWRYLGWPGTRYAWHAFQHRVSWSRLIGMSFFLGFRGILLGNGVVCME